MSASLPTPGKARHTEVITLIGRWLQQLRRARARWDYFSYPDSARNAWVIGVERVHNGEVLSREVMAWTLMSPQEITRFEKHAMERAKMYNRARAF